MHAADQVPMLVRQIQFNARLPVARDAERAAITVLRVLVPQLPANAAAARTSALLEALVLAQGDDEGTATPQRAVMREFGVPPERAAELTDAVTVALLETLGDDAPALFAALPGALRPAASGADDAERAHAPGNGKTLAEGRPGSRHPLARARPGRPQSESLVSSDDPHAASRLSSTEGLSPERSGHTLADTTHASERALAGPPGPPY